MFPEYRELISALKGNHKRFDSLFESIINLITK